MFGIDISIFYITSYIVFGLAMLFLWATAISGIKFYQLDIGRKDVKSIKVLIHIAMLAAIACFVFLCFEKDLNVKEVESGQKTEEIQEEPSATEHRPYDW
jgi:hypothetical protein